MNKFGIIFQLLLFFAPWVIRRRALCFFWGANIHKEARIGFSIFLNCGRICINRGARIGHLNLIKGVDLLDLGVNSKIGNLNWITAFPSSNKVHFSHVLGRSAQLSIGDESAITNRHLIDCTDSIVIGRFSTFGGFRSQILTHSVNIYSSRQDCKPVKIGDYCFVGTSCCLLGGASLPGYSVLAAGSVLTSEFDRAFFLYAGVPAKPVKRLSNDALYFSREVGFII